MWGIAQESSSGTRRFVGAGALCGTAMGAALQSLNERNERWFKIWRDLRGRNSTEDGYIATWTELAAQRICFTFFHVFPHIFVWGSGFWLGTPALTPPSASPRLLPHNLFTHNLLTHNSLTHNSLTHNLSTHNLSTHNLSAHNLRPGTGQRRHSLPASLTLARNQSVPPEPRAKFESFEISSS